MDTIHSLKGIGFSLKYSCKDLIYSEIKLFNAVYFVVVNTGSCK